MNIRIRTFIDSLHYLVSQVYSHYFSSKSRMLVARFLYLAVYLLSFGYTAFAQDKLQWAYTFQPSSTMYPVDQVQVDRSNNIYISYWYMSSTEVDPYDPSVTISTGHPTWIVPHIRKYNSDGEYLFSFPTLAGVTRQVMTVDASNNLIVSGFFNGTRDFNHGAGTYNMTALGSYGADYFIAKYDQNGVFLWAKQMVINFPSLISSNLFRIFDVKSDGSNNVYITGGFRGTIDFDTGPGTANLTSVGEDDMFVAKYDASGNYVFAFRIGGSSWEGGQEIAVTSAQEIVVAGQYGGTVDFDPGVGIYNLTGGGAFLAKYTAAGDFAWANSLGGLSHNDLEVDGSDNIYLSNNNTDIKKYTNGGAIAWSFSLSNTVGGSKLKIDLSNNNVIISGGNSSGSVDVDPSGGVNSLLGGCYRNFFARYSSTGSLISAFEYSKNGIRVDEAGFGIDNSGNILTGGTLSENLEYVNFVSPTSTVSNYFRFKYYGTRAAYIAKYAYNTPPIIAESTVPFGCWNDFRVLTASGTLGAPYYWTYGKCGGTPVPSSGLPQTSITTSNTSGVREYWVRSGTKCARLSLGNTPGANTTPSFANASPTNLPCTGGTVTLTSNAPSIPACSPYSASSATQAVWYSGSCRGTYVGTGTSITVSPTVTTTYYVAHENCNGYSGGCQSVTVTVAPSPTAPIRSTITQPTCNTPTGSVLLLGLPAAGTWTITRTPGGTTYTGTGTSYTVTGLAPGTYTFTVTNASGCISPASASAIINAAPPAPTAPVPGTPTQPTCSTPTGSVLLTGLPGTGTWTLTRSPGGTTTGSGTSYTASGLPAGATYTFTVTNASGCTSPPSTSVVISAAPTAPTAPIPATPTQPTCAVPTGSVVLNGLPAVGTWTLTRSPGGNITGSGTSYTVTGLPASTSYTFTVTNASGCTSAPSISVVIGAAPPSPSAPIPATPTQPTCAVPTGSVVLTGLPGVGTWTLTRSPGGTTTGSGTTYTVTGLPVGTTYTFTVTNASGCTSLASTNVIINAIPTDPVLGGGVEVCIGLTANVTPNTGGTWSSSNTSVATVTNGGVVTGVSAGTVTLTYTRTSDGCDQTMSFTVNPTPTVSITGSNSICIGATTTLSPTTGGTWLSSNPAVATVTNSGVVTGVSAGTAMFTFTNSTTGCISEPTGSITVYETPSVSITGSNPICVGQTTTLSPSTGGTWLSSNPAVATVTNAGVVTGLSAGSATFTYTNSSTGCSSNPTLAITINANPSEPIVGTITQPTCIVSSGSVDLSGLPASGTWTITRTPGGTTSGSGVSTTISNLPAGASYTFTVTNNNGCTSTSSINVAINPIPGAPVLGGDIEVCEGLTANVTPSTLGTWSSSNVAVATVNNAGLVTGVSAGTVTLTYTRTSDGCSNSMSFTVNPTPITSVNGSNSICIGSTTSLSPNTGGVWTSSNPAVATVDNTGLVTGVSEGIATFTFVNSTTGCSSDASASVTVNPTPVVSITGSNPICVGQTTALSPNIGGTWASSNTAVATVDNSGLVTGVSAGTATFTFTNSITGCSSNPTTAITVNPKPSVLIIGSNPICEGQTTTLSPTTGGTWVSSNPAVATVTNAGVVTGVSAGNVTFIFTSSSTGCTSDATASLTVNAKPTVLITSASPICVGETTTLSPTTGGTWTSSNPVVATVDNSGLVTGVSAGTVTFTFTSSATGCSSDITPALTVNALPALPSGTSSYTICIGQSASMSLSLPTGSTVVWYDNSAGTGVSLSTSNPYVVSPTSTTTYYAFSVSAAGCRSNGSYPVTVNVIAIPAEPSGTADDTICIGQNIALTVVLPSGSTVVWYDNASASGSPLSTSNPFVVSPTVTTTYFAFSDNGICLSSSPFAITIEVLAIPVAPSGVDTITICRGQSASLSASFPLGTDIYWYDNAGGIGIPLSTQNLYVVSPLSTTTYYGFSNNSYCNSDSAYIVTVEVLSIPLPPTGTASYTICEGDTVALLVNVALGNTVEWYDGPLGLGTLVSTDNPFLVWPSGTISYYAFATNGYCLSDGGLKVTVNVLSIPIAPTGDTLYTICIGDSVSMILNYGSGLNLEWYNNPLGLGSPLSTSNPFVVYPTSDTVFYAFTNNTVCSSSDSLAVYINVLSYPNTPTGDTLYTICAGDSISLQVLVDSGMLVYWYNSNLGTGVPVSTNNPYVVSPSVTTTYYVYANNGFCSSSGYLEVEVAVYDIPAAPTGDTLYGICLGDTATILLNIPSGTSLSWYDNAGGIGIPVSTDNPLVISPLQDTVLYAYSLNGICLSHDSLVVYVQVFEHPEITLTAQNARCFNTNDAQITASISGGTAPYGYMWSNGSDELVIDSLITGTYTLIVVDSVGCSDTSSASVIVPPSMSIDISGTNAFCSDEVSMYVASGTGVVGYEWSTGETNDTIYYVGIETGHLYVTATNDSLCEEVDSVYITIHETPTIDIAYDSIICSYEDVVFIATTNGGVLWSTGQDGVSISIDPNNIPDTIWATTLNTFGCSDTAFLSDISVLVNPSPIADFDTLTAGYLPSLYSFYDSSSADVVTWLWDFNDGITTTIENPKHYFDHAGTFEVILVVSNEFGCIDTAKILIEVGEAITVPNVFTPNGDGKNDLFIIPYAGLEDAKMEIRNRWGTKMYEANGRNLYWDGRTNAGSLVSQGTYYYFVTARGAHQDYNLTGIVTLLR